MVQEIGEAFDVNIADHRSRYSRVDSGLFFEASVGGKELGRVELQGSPCVRRLP